MDIKELEMELVLLDSFLFKPSDVERIPEYFQTPKSLCRALADASCISTPLTPYPSSSNDSLVPPIDASISDLRVRLHPPSLFHCPLQYLVEEYVDQYPALRHAIPLLLLWRDSHNIPSSELTSTCIILMIIASLLVKDEAISLEQLSMKEDLEWLEWQDISTISTPPRGQMDWAVWRELHSAKRIAENQPRFSLTIESVLLAFFQVWLGDRFLHIKSAVSVRRGGFIPRVAPQVPNESNSEPVARPLQDVQPKSWDKAILVVQDPFLLTHCNMPSIKVKWAREQTVKKVADVIRNKNVGRALQRAGFTQVVAIANATVPIVKFLDPDTGMHIDLNCNEQLGLINTILLNNYCLAWPYLRYMLFFIKKWAKSLGLNDPSGVNGPSSFSSYCFALMTVAYLQVKGVLPHLQQNAVGEVDRESSGFWMRSRPNKSDDRVWCDTRFDAPDDGWTGMPMSLEEAVCGWFRYYAYEHKYKQDIVSIQCGGLTPRQRPFVYDEARLEVRRETAKARRQKRTTEGSSPTKTGFESRAEPPDRASLPTAESGRSHVTSIADTANDTHVTAAQAQAVTALVIDQETADALEEEEEEEEEEGAEHGDDGLELLQSDTWDQPSAWAKSRLVVVDPFIKVKNCTSACKPAVIDRFQYECQRAVSMLELGQPVEKLFGDGSSLFAGRDGNPRRTQRPLRQERPKPAKVAQPALPTNTNPRSNDNRYSTSTASGSPPSLPSPQSPHQNQQGVSQTAKKAKSSPRQQQQIQQQLQHEYLLHQQHLLQQQVANSYLSYHQFLHQMSMQPHQPLQTEPAQQFPTPGPMPAPNALNSVPAHHAPAPDRRNPTSSQFHQAVLQAAGSRQPRSKG
ncbi:hypothetical protein FRB96_001225 [Tulasnella sp. 330]|nr:hypothetical protein FRB96_001225 [Tulasnella sp. 330]